jgi:ABC-type antimicrobial peptide transport system permease subunit
VSLHRQAKRRIRSGLFPGLSNRSIAAELRLQIKDVEPSVRVDRIEPLTDVLWETLAADRYRAALVNIFAMVAGGLALVGLYGVASRFVTSRNRELGIRSALGARPAHCNGSFFGEVLG